MNEDHLCSLPKRVRANSKAFDMSKMYLICNGHKILMSIGEMFGRDMLQMIFKDSKMHKPVTQSVNINKCLNVESRQVFEIISSYLVNTLYLAKYC